TELHAAFLPDFGHPGGWGNLGHELGEAYPGYLIHLAGDLVGSPGSAILSSPGPGADVAPTAVSLPAFSLPGVALPGPTGESRRPGPEREAGPAERSARPEPPSARAVVEAA